MPRPTRQPLVVVAHPDQGSFCHALLKAAIAGFDEAGVQPDVIDLYRDGFAAAMTTDERLAYHGDDPILDEQVRDYAARILAADGVVFVYPTWWSSLPAVLKGFMDRVLVPGVGFELSPTSGLVRPGLQNLRHIVGVSTYGSPRRYVRFVNDNGRRHLTRTLRLTAGLRCRTHWLGMYEMDTSTAADRELFLTKVSDKMTRLAGVSTSAGVSATSGGQ